MMINSRPRVARNDLLPTMKLQTLAISDLTMPKNMVRKLDPGHIKEVANNIQAMGFSGDQGRARRRSVSTKVPILVGHDVGPFHLAADIKRVGFWSAQREARADLTMFLGLLFLLIVGAGRWSLDARLSRRVGKLSSLEPSQ
jgi:hypothetical protein